MSHTHASVTIAQLNEFERIFHTYGKGASRQKIKLLKEISHQKINKANVIKTYHEMLLYLKAYPDSRELLNLVEAELKRIAVAVDMIMKRKNYREQIALSGTGIAGSNVIGQFSLEIAEWMIGNFDNGVSFDSAGGDDVSAAGILQLLLPGSEFYFATQENISLQTRLIKLFGNKEKILERLLRLFTAWSVNKKIKAELYDQLKIFIHWRLDNHFFNRSFICGVNTGIFFHRVLQKKVQAIEVVKKPLPVCLPLTANQKKQLTDVARASLAFYCRETDPVSYADESMVKLFDCGRGISVALYQMEPERRLTIESYIGYLAFKNNIPVSYGGGWIFGDRCKIGVNIYPPFRGGESALLFSQVLRVYHQHFNIQRFVVKPYQFGKGNTEGLKSGAFWFYYKAGFQPADEQIAELAAMLFNQKEKTSISKLRQLAKRNMELVLNPFLPHDFDVALISKTITKHIKTTFAGNREEAIHFSMRKLKKNLGIKNMDILKEYQLKHWKQFSLICALLPRLHEWKQSEKKGLLQLILAKAGKDEKEYISATQRHPIFVKSLYELFQMR